MIQVTIDERSTAVFIYNPHVLGVRFPLKSARGPPHIGRTDFPPRQAIQTRGSGLLEPDAIEIGTPASRRMTDPGRSEWEG